MGIDLNKELSFGRRRSTAGDLPTKTSMNLLPPDQFHADAKRAIPLALLLALFVALFAKFGVIDFFDQVSQSQAALDQQQALLSKEQAAASDFEALEDEYKSYTGLAVHEGQVDALQATDLVRNAIEPNASVVAVTMAQGTLTVNIKDVTLDELGRLTDTVRIQPIVKDVSVTTASRQQEDGTVQAALVIELASQDGKGA